MAQRRRAPKRRQEDVHAALGEPMLETGAQHRMVAMNPGALATREGDVWKVISPFRGLAK